MADESRKCPLCDRTTRGAAPGQTVSDDPAMLDRLLRGLRERVRAIEDGRTTPEQAYAETERMCASCRGLLSGIMGPRAAEIVQQLRLQIRRLEARLEAVEDNRDPSAEHAPRLPGPGDRAEDEDTAPGAR